MSTAATRRSRSALDPDTLAALEEERDFLARSLADLERERAAGDMDDADYAALRDDYVARTAEVLRSIEQRRMAFAAARRPPRPWARIAAAVSVAAFAVIAGLLVARLAGDRTSAATITGDVRASTRQQLATCLELAGAAMQGSGGLLGAVQCYDGVLDRQPSNAEALAYRGWLLVRTGEERLVRAGAANLDAAVAADPTYPDARAFRAVVMFRLGEVDAAKAELDALDMLSPPPIIDQLLDQFGVRAGVAAALGQGNGTGSP